MPAAATTTAATRQVKPHKPTFGLWWLLWMALGMLFFFAVAYGSRF
jgi:hypothetical protein